VKYILCGKIVHAGVRRLKQHLVGGHGDVAKCPKITSAISKEMHEYLKKNVRQKPLDLDDDKEGEKDDEVQVIGEGESRASHSVIQSSFGTALKRRLSAEASQSNQSVSKSSRSIASMLRKAPEEVVRERHCKNNTQTTLPKKSKEKRKQLICMLLILFMTLAYHLMLSTQGPLKSCLRRLGNMVLSM
jgi:hypothetical protein